MKTIKDMLAQAVDRPSDAQSLDEATKGDKNQDKALAAFTKATTEAAVLARKIVANLDDHMGKNPDRVTWADEGSASKVLSDLKEIARFLKIRT